MPNVHAFTLALLLCLLPLPACGDSSDCSTTTGECVEPDWQEAKDPFFKSCVCFDGPAYHECHGAKGSCAGIQGGTCQPPCPDSNAAYGGCPIVYGSQTVCGGGGCFIKCNDGCPTGMHCEGDACIHDAS